MAIYLQPVVIPERCFLFEALLWVAFQRLPVAQSDMEGNDIRESDEIRGSGRGGYEIDVIDTYIFDEECEYAGIPPDPAWRAVVEGTTTIPVLHYDRLLAEKDLTEKYRDELEAGREEAVRLEAKTDEWKRQYQSAIEYPASRIFVALRDGQLIGKGKLLPAVDVDEALAKLSEDEAEVFGIEPTSISPTFWSLQGIDFEISAARNDRAHYCHITFATKELLSAFPGERRPVSGVEQVGDSFIVTEAPKGLVRGARGRPSYPWEAFHLQVASLLQKGELPKKKEAAIQLLQDWFERELGVRPSRAAVSQKLTPYYETLLRPGGQKTG